MSENEDKMMISISHERHMRRAFAAGQAAAMARVLSKRKGAEAPANAPTDERLSDGQHADHYVLCPEDRAKGYVEPLRIDYIHEKCGGVTTMPRACAETYAVQPSYYGSMFCCTCRGYFPVDASGEFIWNDDSGQKVGTRRTS